MPRRSAKDTERTRQEILSKAMDLASIDGLEGLTIGRLASAASMSKSGLFAHFGSKEELQLAVIDAARDVFSRQVLAQAADAETGLPRLARLSAAWLDYVEKGHFRGGCFFAAISAEVDDRPGRVRDRIIDLTRSWVEAIEGEAEAAIEAGHLNPDALPDQIAFEIHAFVQEANWAFQLHGDAAAFSRAARAIRRSLHLDATETGTDFLERDGA